VRNVVTLPTYQLHDLKKDGCYRRMVDERRNTVHKGRVLHDSTVISIMHGFALMAKDKYNTNIGKTHMDSKASRRTKTQLCSWW